MDASPSTSVNNTEEAVIEAVEGNFPSSNEINVITSENELSVNVRSEELLANTENVQVNEPDCENEIENITITESYTDNINLQVLDLVAMAEKNEIDMSKPECSTSENQNICDTDDNVEDLWLESGTSGLVKVDEDFEVIVKSLETAIVETERYDIDTVLSSDKESIINEAEKVIDKLEKAIIEATCDASEGMSSDSLLNDLSKELLPSPLVTPSLSEIVEEGEKVMLSDNIEIGDDITKELEAESSKIQTKMACMQDQCLENLIEPSMNDFTTITDDIENCESYDEQTNSLFDPADSITELPGSFENQPSILEIQEATMMCDISEEINKNLVNPMSSTMEDSSFSNIIDNTDKVLESLNEELIVEDLEEDEEAQLLASPTKSTAGSYVDKTEVMSCTSSLFENIVASEIEPKILPSLDTVDDVSDEQILETIFKIDSSNSMLTKEIMLEDQNNDDQEILSEKMNSNIESENIADIAGNDDLSILNDIGNENIEIPANEELNLECENAGFEIESENITDITPNDDLALLNDVGNENIETPVSEELNLECENAGYEIESENITDIIANDDLAMLNDVGNENIETPVSAELNLECENAGFEIESENITNITANDDLAVLNDGNENIETPVSEELNLECENAGFDETGEAAKIDKDDQDVLENKVISSDCENLKFDEINLQNELHDEGQNMPIINEFNLESENKEYEEVEEKTENSNADQNTIINQQSDSEYKSPESEEIEQKIKINADLNISIDQGFDLKENTELDEIQQKNEIENENKCTSVNQELIAETENTECEEIREEIETSDLVQDTENTKCKNITQEIEISNLFQDTENTKCEKNTEKTDISDLVQDTKNTKYETITQKTEITDLVQDTSDNEEINLECENTQFEEIVHNEPGNADENTLINRQLNVEQSEAKCEKTAVQNECEKNENIQSKNDEEKCLVVNQELDVECIQKELDVSEINDVNIEKQFVNENKEDLINHKLNLERDSTQIEELEETQNLILEKEIDNENNKTSLVSTELNLECTNETSEDIENNDSITQDVDEVHKENRDLSTNEDLNLACTNTEAAEINTKDDLVIEQETDNELKQISINNESNVVSAKEMEDITKETNTVNEKQTDNDDKENTHVEQEEIELKNDEITEKITEIEDEVIHSFSQELIEECIENTTPKTHINMTDQTDHEMKEYIINEEIIPSIKEEVNEEAAENTSAKTDTIMTDQTDDEIKENIINEEIISSINEECVENTLVKTGIIVTDQTVDKLQEDNINEEFILSINEGCVEYTTAKTDIIMIDQTGDHQKEDIINEEFVHSINEEINQGCVENTTAKTDLIMTDQTDHKLKEDIINEEIIHSFNEEYIENTPAKTDTVITDQIDDEIKEDVINEELNIQIINTELEIVNAESEQNIITNDSALDDIHSASEILAQTITSPEINIHTSIEENIEKLTGEHIGKPIDEHIEKSVDEYIENPTDEHIEISTDEHIRKPIDEHIEKPADEHIEKSADEHIEISTDEHIEKSIDEHIGKPIEEHIEKPVVKQIEKPTDEHIEKPIDKHIEKPIDKYIGKPIHEDIEKTIDEHIAKPTDECIEKLIDKHFEKSMDEHIGTPIDEHIEKPTDEHIEKPIVEQIEKSTDEHIEKPIDKHIEKPIDEYIGKPIDEDIEKTIDEHIGKPIDEDIEKTIDEHIAKPTDECIEKLIDKHFEKSMDEHIGTPIDEHIENPTDEHIEKPIVEQIEKSTDEHIEKPIDKHIEKPIDEYIGKPIDEDIEKTIDEHIGKPIDEDIEKTIHEHIEKSTDEHTQRPIDKHIEKPLDEYIEKAIDEYIEKSTDEHIEKPIDEHIEKATDEHIEKPIDKHIEKPIDEYIGKPIDEDIEIPIYEHIDKALDEHIEISIDEHIEKALDENVKNAHEENLMESINQNRETQLEEYVLDEKIEEVSSMENQINEECENKEAEQPLLEQADENKTVEHSSDVVEEINKSLLELEESISEDTNELSCEDLEINKSLEEIEKSIQFVPSATDLEEVVIFDTLEEETTCLDVPETKSFDILERGVIEKLNSKECKEEIVPEQGELKINNPEQIRDVEYENVKEQIEMTKGIISVEEKFVTEDKVEDTEKYNVEAAYSATLEHSKTEEMKDDCETSINELLTLISQPNSNDETNYANSKQIIAESSKAVPETETKKVNIIIIEESTKQTTSAHNKTVAKEDERNSTEYSKKHSLPPDVKLQSPPKKIKLIRQKQPTKVYTYVPEVPKSHNEPELFKDKEEISRTETNKIVITVRAEIENEPKDSSPPKSNIKQKLKLKRTYKMPAIAETSVTSSQKLESVAKCTEVTIKEKVKEPDLTTADDKLSPVNKKEVEDIVSILCNEQSLDEVIQIPDEIIKDIQTTVKDNKQDNQQTLFETLEEILECKVSSSVSPKTEIQTKTELQVKVDEIIILEDQVENNSIGAIIEVKMDDSNIHTEEDLNIDSENKLAEETKKEKTNFSGTVITKCQETMENNSVSDVNIPVIQVSQFEEKGEIDKYLLNTNSKCEAEQFKKDKLIEQKESVSKEINVGSSLIENLISSAETESKEKSSTLEQATVVNMLEQNDIQEICKAVESIIPVEETVIKDFQNDPIIVPLENEIKISNVRSLVTAPMKAISTRFIPEVRKLKMNEDLTIEPIQRSNDGRRSLKRKLTVDDSEQPNAKSVVIRKPLSVEIDDFEQTTEKEPENFPKIIIKPIPKPEERCSPKITIKPIKPPEIAETSRAYKLQKHIPDDVSMPKITIKPVVKSTDPLKITITKQRSDDTHSILKIYKPDEDSALVETIPKLTIKPITKTDDVQHSSRVTIKPVKMPTNQHSSVSSISPKITVKPILPPTEQQIQITHLPKVSIKPIMNPEDSYPKVTIKPILRPDDSQKLQQLSPRQLKVKSMTFESTSGVTVEPISLTPPSPSVQKSDGDGLLSPLKISVKPFAKMEESLSPKLTIKPITKTCEIVQTEDGITNPLKLTIKPLLKSEESYQSPKITIKPIIKPEVNELTMEEIDKPERIILKINKNSLSSPKERSMYHMREQKKEPEIRIEAIPHDSDRNQKLDKIKLKLTKEGNHAQIIPSTSSFNIEQPFHLKRALAMPDTNILEKRGRTELSGTEIIHTSDISINLVEPNAKPNPKIISEEVTILKIEKPQISGRTTATEPISQSKFKEMLLKIQQKSNITCTPHIDHHEDSSSSDDVKIIGVIENDPPTDPLSLNDESSSQDVVIVNEIINANPFHDVKIIGVPSMCDNIIPMSVPKKRGRPRKNPLQVKPEIKGEDCVEIIRPKRTCRAPAGRAPYIIKERKPRGAGRGRGRGRGASKAVQKIPKEPKSPRGKALREAKALAKLEAARLQKEIVIDAITIEDSTDDAPTPTPTPTPVPPAEEVVNKLPEIKVPEVQMCEPVVKIMQISEALLKQPQPPPVAVYEEETRMSADNNNSRSQTPARQVVIPPTPEGPEESQSSVQSTATTESNKNKKGRLEVCDPDSAVTLVEQIAEYSWGGGGPYMLQEQIAQYLGVKSFKRKYPGLSRRPVEMQERDYIRENGLVSESMCDMGLTAVPSSEILDIMYTDFQDKYEEYRKFMRDKQSKEISNKQKAISLATSQEKNKIDFKERAVRSAANWNINFNKARKESRRCCMDLQTFTINYPIGRSKDKVPVKNPVGHYPIALVPGQFTDFHKSYTTNELHYLPLNTVRYGPVLPNQQQWDDGGQSDASQSDSDSSSGSDSDSSDDSMSTTEDTATVAAQALCKPTTVTLTPLVLPNKTKVH